MTGLGFFAIARGIRMHTPRMAYDFYQWGRLIDLIRRLDINVFLDVGANRGFFSKHLRMSGYKGRLISFEPIPEDQEHIYQFARHDHDWQVCRYALGAETGRKQFRINLSCNETVLSSFLPLRGRSSSKIIDVEINRLDEIFPQLIEGITLPRVFLKMDTQGFDGQVFEGAKGCLSNIFGLQSEVAVTPLYDGMPHYTLLLKTYEQSGFSLIDMFVVRRTDDGRILEYDCVMAKPEALK